MTECYHCWIIKAVCTFQKLFIWRLSWREAPLLHMAPASLTYIFLSPTSLHLRPRRYKYEPMLRFLILHLAFHYSPPQWPTSILIPLSLTHNIVIPLQPNQSYGIYANHLSMHATQRIPGIQCPTSISPNQPLNHKSQLYTSYVTYFQATGLSGHLAQVASQSMMCLTPSILR